jgi:transposase
MLLTIRPLEYDIFIGVDVDSKSYAISYCDHDNQGRSLKMPADPKNLYAYFKKRFLGKRLLFIYEAGPTGYDLYDHLTGQGESCIVVHPAGVPTASNRCVKTNRLDSLNLMREAKNGKIKGIRVPSEAYRELRHLVNLRQQYATAQKQAKQRIKAFILFEHIHLPDLANVTDYTNRWRSALKQAPLSSTHRFKLDLLLKDLDDARARILLVLRQMRQFLKNEEALARNLAYLQSIPGFGFIVSSYLLSRTGDPAFLKDVRELGAFSGIVPREYSTGDNVQRGSITHMGDSNLRRLLVEAAWIAIRKDGELAQFYSRIRSKRGKAGARIAIVAVARKLTCRVYRVLKDQRPYRIHQSRTEIPKNIRCPKSQEIELVTV